LPVADDKREEVLHKLKSKWEMACASYEAAWNSKLATAGSQGRSEKQYSPLNALAELMSVKKELDSLVTELKGEKRQDSEGPFIVGIINLPGFQQVA
jgi:hypothetical protein